MQQNLIKKALYKAQYRGIKEADCIISVYVKNNVHTLNTDQLKTLLDFLDNSDHDILQMVSGNRTYDEKYNFIVSEMIKQKGIQ